MNIKHPWLQYSLIAAVIIIVYFIVGVMIWGCAFASSTCESILPIFYPAMLIFEMLSGNF